jgi:gliding motility-associated-like protein
MSGSDSICNGDNFNISLMLSGAAPYTITYTDGLNNYAASGISTSQATLNVQPAQSSNFIPVSLVDNNGCYASSISGTANVIVSAIPTANAGPDAEICGLTFDLSALPSLGIGAWVSQSGVTYHDINNAAADVTVPVGGEYIFTWKENNNGCISMDDVKIIFYDQVTANAGDDQDVYFTNTAQLSGIEMPGNKTWSLLSGNGIIASPNDLNSFVHELGSGENVFKLTVVNGVCPATEDEVKLLVHELEIPNSFTPNGDNINDKFVIRNLEHARSNNLKVFNSWGAEIFTAADYMNDWDGTNKDGGPLSPDTYYYVLEINGEMHSGFIVLKR